MWDSLDVDLSKLADRGSLSAAMGERYPDAKPKTIMNWVSQVWPFAHEIKKDDLVVLPLKTQPAICVGEVSGEYHFEASGPGPFFHWRPVKWIAESIPRATSARTFSSDPARSCTICRVQRNNAEARIGAMRANGWKPETIAAAKEPGPALAFMLLKTKHCPTSQAGD